MRVVAGSGVRDFASKFMGGSGSSYADASRSGPRYAGSECYSAGAGARYLIILTPRIVALISALQADGDPSHQHDIYRRFDSELLE